jgi:histidinol-phosphate phosphatase family protein
VSIVFDVVVPTVGRACLSDLLQTMADDVAAGGSLPSRIVLCDDRPSPEPGQPLLPTPPPAALADRVEVLTTGGRGPAAARNAGWRHATGPWIAFLDDDVLLPPGWSSALIRDLEELGASIGASQGRIHVPLPRDRRPTDWERNVAGLESARWATADMAYRRSVLEAVGGFDERFPRAYREDADLGLRVTAAGYVIVRGRRHVIHPARPTDDTVSVRMQAGNADDPFMRALHGPDWRRRAGVPQGRRPWHLATVASALVAVVAAVARWPRTAGLAAATWVALTVDLTWRRIAPGPRTRDEVARMVRTSVMLPFAAVGYWVRGLVTLPRRLARSGPQPAAADRPMVGEVRTEAGTVVIDITEARATRPAAVLFDRDGTLVHDEPYNGDPDLVRPVEGAREAVARLRALGVPTAVITNQSGIARGHITREQVDAVNDRLDELIGPLGPVLVCPHGPGDGCDCRKPAPGLIFAAARLLGVDPADCVVIGDIGADVEAAEAAGARGILVPTAITRDDEVAGAAEVASDLAAAVDAALRPAPSRTRSG